MEMSGAGEEAGAALRRVLERLDALEFQNAAARSENAALRTEVVALRDQVARGARARHQISQRG